MSARIMLALALAYIIGIMVVTPNREPDVFGAISRPARRRMLDLLAEARPLRQRACGKFPDEPPGRLAASPRPARCRSRDGAAAWSRTPLSPRPCAAQARTGLDGIL